MTKISDDLINNDVPAVSQIKDSDCVSFFITDNADLKIAFLGNSITRHGRAANIGWYGDWGMAASSKENDYVHKLVDRLNKDGYKVSYCVANLSEWECSRNDGLFDERYSAVKDFCADVIIVRLGENARLLDSVDEFAPHYENLINCFAEANAKIVLTDLFWEYEPFDTYVKNLADLRGCAFVQIHDLSSDGRMKAVGLYEHQGVAAHPNDKGMQEIADRIYKSMCSALSY